MECAQDAGAKLLVVDDNEQNRLLTATRLLAAGYRVTEADSGFRALSLFESQQHDLVLLDVNMPGLDGFATLERLRALPGGADVTVIFLTALDDEQTHQDALRAGVDDFLTKPIRGAELLIRVRSLLRLTDTLRALRESHALVSRQRDELVQARDLREQLSAFLVHDLKSPVATVSAVTGLLRYKVREPNVQRALRGVERACDDMNRMLLNLLDVARMQDGKLSPDRRPVDLHGLLERVVGRARETHPKADSRLKTHYQLEQAQVLADAELLRRIMENLLDNAFRHSPQDAPVTVSAARADGLIEIVVADEGPGIADEDRERVFEMYEQLDQADHHRSGRGLGLVFCRAAIEAHGGSIWVEPATPERGAAFHLRFPPS